MSRFKWLEFDPPAETPGGVVDPASPDQDADLSDPGMVLRKADETYAELKYEKALRLYSRTLTLDPTLEQGWAGQLRCLLDLDENPEALTWAVKAHKLFAKSPDIISARAVALARQGNQSEALAFSDGAMKYQGVDWFFWVARGEILGLAGSPNADFCLLKAREERSNDVMVQFKAAQAYTRIRLPEKGIPIFQKALARKPDVAQGWYELGLAHMAIGAFAEARSSFEKASRLEPLERAYQEALTEAEEKTPLDRALHWFGSLFGKRGGKR